MAATTTTSHGSYNPPESRRIHDASAANTQLVVTVGPLSRPWRLLSVEVGYSSAVTKDVSVVRDSGAGAAYDRTLQTIALAAAANGVFLPDNVLPFMQDDSLVITAPAGGGGITSTIAVYIGFLP